MKSVFEIFVAILAFIPVDAYTQCNDKYLGWSRVNGTFSDKHLITICDKRFRGGSIYKKVKKKYSQIDCYIDDTTKELYSCRFHHLYGTFIEYANIFRFSAYCVIAKETKKYLQSGIKIDDENIENLDQLFRSLMIEIDSVNPPPIYSKSYMNIINQNVWVYDNINAISRCMSIVPWPSKPQFIANPFHCLGALSLLFEYQYLLNETRQQSTFVAVRYNKNTFGEDALTTSLLKTYFAEIMTIEDVMEYEDELYIKELRFNGKNWIKYSIFLSRYKCNQESQILMDMKYAAKVYWNERITLSMKNNWLYLIDKDKKKNAFEIYTRNRCFDGYRYMETLDSMKNIMFVLSEYDIDGKCDGKRCIGRMDVFVDDLVNGLLYNDDYDLIDAVIVGNPELLTLELQYLLFERSNVLIGVSDDILSVAALFMEEASVMFEIVLDDVFNMEDLAEMMGLKYYNMNHMIDVDMISSNFIASKLMNSVL